MTPNCLVLNTELLPIFGQEMDFNSIQAAIIYTVAEKDSVKSYKELQLKCWCNAFSVLFNDAIQECLPFILEVLSDAECWKKTNTVHRVKLNRRTVARKLVQSHSKTGMINPLSDFQRYQIACWCCLEEDIPALFEKIKQNNKAESTDTITLRNFVRELLSSYFLEPLVCFWTRVACGFVSDLRLQGMNLYEYGLHYSFDTHNKWKHQHVEAVEFFLNKIKSLSEHELSTGKKREILMKTALRAAKLPVGKHSEILKFCISQLSPYDYPEFLRNDSNFCRIYNSCVVFAHFWSFAELQKLLEFIGPNNISEEAYATVLISLDLHEYPENFANEAVKLFMYMWNKEGFDQHRNFLLLTELIRSEWEKGRILISLVERNYMDVVWAILDKTHFSQIIEFVKTEKACYIRSLLKQRNDLYSVNKLCSYMHPSRTINDRRTSSMVIYTDSINTRDVQDGSQRKRLRKE